MGRDHPPTLAPGRSPRIQAIPTTHPYHPGDRPRAIYSRDGLEIRADDQEDRRGACATSSTRVKSSHGVQRRCSSALLVVLGKCGGERGRSTRTSVRRRATSLEGWKLKRRCCSHRPRIRNRCWSLRLLLLPVAAVGRIRGGPLDCGFDSRLVLCGIIAFMLRFL